MPGVVALELAEDCLVQLATQRVVDAHVTMTAAMRSAPFGSGEFNLQAPMTPDHSLLRTARLHNGANRTEIDRQLVGIREP